jgi:FdhE protein
MTASVETSLQNLRRQRPEWEPWLAVVRVVIEETADGDKWDAWVSEPSGAPENKVPLLSGCTIALEKNPIAQWIDRVVRTAFKSGTEEMATLEAVAGVPDSFPLFKAALCQDGASLGNTAVRLGADTEAFQAVASQLPIPFLHACNRQWARMVPESWIEGYCPVCGAWPSFAEVRGIERGRHLRCGRCAAEWQLDTLLCPYCGMDDHEQLVRLVPEKGGTTRIVDACKRCLGYIKTFTMLQATPPARIILDDLASVDLDMAALEQGYRRPPGPGYTVDVALVEKSSGGGRFFPWKR